MSSESIPIRAKEEDVHNCAESNIVQEPESPEVKKVIKPEVQEREPVVESPGEEVQEREPVENPGEEVQEREPVVENPGEEVGDQRTKATLKKCLTVAFRNKALQAKMVKDPQVSNRLLRSLMDRDEEILTYALEVFEVLLLEENNIPLLQNLPYFVKTLEKLSKSRKRCSEVRNDAAKMLQKLQEPRAPLCEQSNSSRNGSNTTTKPHHGKRQRNQEKSSVNNRSKNQNGRETVLFVDNAVKEQPYVRTRISNTLIKVPGIISVTYNLEKNFCIIRGKSTVPRSVFAYAVANLGYKVSVVRQTVNKQEILIPVEIVKKDVSTKENMPEYLPEEDDDVLVGDNAVAGGNEEDKKNQNQSSWFTSAKTFVASSFYW